MTTPGPRGAAPVPDGGWASAQEAFASAATWFVEVTGRVGDRWAEPGIGQWSIRDLVGHTSRALLTIESYLGRDDKAERIGSAVAYYRSALAGLGDPEAVAQRGRDAGTALGADPVAAVRAIADRVTPLVRADDGSTPVGTPVGVMRLQDYLPTRTFELVVHTGDLSAALGQSSELPPAAAAESLHLLADLALDSGGAMPLLRAGTGRGDLPDGFTVL